MAKKKKTPPPWAKLKFVSEWTYKEYEEMSEEDLVAKLKEKRKDELDFKRAKSTSGMLKEVREEIKEFRDNWVAENPKLADEILECKERVKEIEAERDEKIENDLEEKKTEEGAMGDQVKGAREHIEVLLDFLRKKV